jgi:hypothetical protein
MARKAVYKLAKGEAAILDRARQEKNPNWITNYYLRSPDTGTYWRYVPESDVKRLKLPEFVEAAERWQEGYAGLFEIWDRLGRPEFFYPDTDRWSAGYLPDYLARSERLERVYRVLADTEDSTRVVFHHPHGALLLPWQLDLFKAQQPLDVVVGGFGSGKTWAKILHMMVRAVLLPGYRGLVLAPYFIQAIEVFTQALSIVASTLYEERFLLRSVTKPFPQLEIGHDGVGRNTIDFFPILDDPDKIRTLTGDEGMVDQIEKLPDIQNVIRVLGTRLRGQYKGRPRVGKITMIGNPDDNPEMWDLVDDAENDPEMIFAYCPATHENTYLTVKDFIRFQKQVGEDAESQGMYLFGNRPKGGGKHFPAESIQRCHDTGLDEYMKENLESGIPGFALVQGGKVGVQKWETAPLSEHEYLVTADPGWDNPPYRNSPVVGVWDITAFAAGGPARLVAFEWVYGNGSPNPWIAKYIEYVMTYKAIGRNGYDATGFQSVYQSLSDTGLEGLLAEPINLGGQKKLSALNLAKKMWADGRFAVPNIPHMFSQLAKYDVNDKQLRQDIVMFILVTAQWLERLYYVDLSEGDEEPYPEYDRTYREEESRYPGRTG